MYIKDSVTFAQATICPMTYGNTNPKPPSLKTTTHNPSPTPSPKSHARKFSRNGVGRDYLMAVTGST